MFTSLPLPRKASDPISLTHHGSAIVHIEGRRNYSSIKLANGQSIMLAKTLHLLVSALPQASFIRIHKSHIINRQYLAQVQIHERKIVLSNGAQIPISRRRLAEVHKLLSVAEI